MKKLKEFICRDTVKMRQYVLIAGIIVSGCLIVIGLYLKLFMVLGILSLNLTLLYYWLAFRCPHCDVYLGEHMTNYKHCPKCGKQIEE